MSKTTEHGDIIINTIWYETDDEEEKLTVADVWAILDRLHTSILDQTPDSPAINILGAALVAIEELDEDLPL